MLPFVFDNTRCLSICFLLANAPACALLGADRVPDPPEAGADASPDAASDALDVDGASAPIESGAPIDPGARCGVNGTDGCGAFMVCDVALGCVECAGDRDCPVTARFCVEGGCVACRTGSEDADAGPNAPDEGCRASAPACWPAEPSCEVACIEDSNCPSDAPFCDGTSGQCWACRADADCAGGVCSPVTRRCVDCVDDASCPSALPRCHRLRGKCVECASNADCGRAEPICDPTTRGCRIGCTSDVQCPDARCDTNVAKCVPLSTDAGPPITAPDDASDQ